MSASKALGPLVVVESNHVTLNRDRANHVTGSKSDDFSMSLLRRTIDTLWRPSGADAVRRDEDLKAAVAAMAAFKPQDEVEGMLAAQAVAMHAATMELARRAMIPDQPYEVAQNFRNTMVKLNRGMIEVVDALDRKRGKHRKQVMRIERVTVQAGGQAIVGNVAPGAAAGGGGKHGTEIEGQPREPAAALEHHTPLGPELPPLRGEKPGREPMPVAGDARESPLPAARRQKHRAANG